MRALLPAILLLLGLASPALAENVVLMVNMNYSREELKALEDVATTRGQRLEVVPPREMIDLAEPMFQERDVLEAKIRQLHPDWSKVKMRAALSEIMRKGSAYSDDPDLAETLGSRMDSLHRRAQEVSNAENRNGSIYDQLNAKAAELEGKGDQVDSIAFSSHSDGANLTGETATRLSSSDLYHLKAQHPGLFNDPRHVLLLGCYNLTKTNGERWRYDFFPNATMLVGFGIRAPSRHNPLSARYIRDMMNKATELDNQLAEQDASLDIGLLQKTFLSMPAFTNSRYPGVVDYCGTIFEGRPGANEIDCAAQWDNFYEQAAKIKNDYIDLRNLHIDPPTDENSPELRSFYNMLQGICPARDNAQFSEEERAQNERFRTSMRESVIRLIFWWNVQQNFRTYFDRDIVDFERALNKLDIHARIPSLDGTMGRVNFVRSYNAVRKELMSRLNRVGSYPRSEETIATSAERSLLKSALEKMKVYEPLYYLEGEDSRGDGEMTSVEHTLELGGIPFNWIEGATVLESR